MSEKHWQDYVTQAFIDDAVERTRSVYPDAKPPYQANFNSPGQWYVANGHGRSVYWAHIREVAEAIAAALNDAARPKPVPVPTLLEAAKAYLDWAWPKPQHDVLRAGARPDIDPGNRIRDLLLAIDNAEAAAKNQPAPTLPEDVLKFVLVAHEWHCTGMRWEDIRFKHGIIQNRMEYFATVPAAFLAKYGGGAA